MASGRRPFQKGYLFDCFGLEDGCSLVDNNYHKEVFAFVGDKVDRGLWEEVHMACWGWDNFSYFFAFFVDHYQT